MMNEKDFDALIHLLDDEDPEVSTHVWERLMDLGREGVNRLEAAYYEENDPVIQKKIEDLIHKITIRDISKELLAWRKEGGNDLAAGWYLVSKLQYPDLDFVPFKNEFNRLVNKTWLEINERMTAADKLKVVNHILFVQEGYKANKEKPNNPENNYINKVFEQKRGNYLSLTLLYLLVCEKLEFPVHGVLLPGYSVLMFNDGDQEFYVDVFNGGLFFTRRDLQRFLAEIKAPENPAYFKPTSNIYLILQMIRQLSADFKKSGDFERAEEMEQVLKDIEIRFE